MLKLSKQSGLVAQIVVFLAFLVLVCLCALGVLLASAALTGVVRLPFLATATATPTVTPWPSPTSLPLPTGSASLTPLPGQWTETATLLPGQATSTPTRTPLRRTVAPTLELIRPSSTPTLEPVFRETPTPETDSVLREVQLKYIAFRTFFQVFSEFHRQLGAEPTLIVNEAWKTRMISALSKLEISASQLAAIKLTDPNYAAYAAYLDELSTETGFMALAYRKGLDRFDSAALQVAAVHLQAMDEVLGKADYEYRAVKSRLATPAVTLIPSLTPDP